MSTPSVRTWPIRTVHVQMGSMAHPMSEPPYRAPHHLSGASGSQGDPERRRAEENKGLTTEALAAHGGDSYSHLYRRVAASISRSNCPASSSTAIRFGPREAGDGEMRKGATGRRPGGDRKTTGRRHEDDRKAAGKRQESDRKRQAGDRKATRELRQEGDRRATGRRQGGDRETTGKRQETRHSDRISDRKATGRRQEGNRASGDRETTGKRQKKATGEQQESDRRATGEQQGVFLRQEGDRKATGRRQESDRLVEDNK